MTTDTASRTNPSYLLDPSWYAERDRLNSLTTLYDATTMQVIDALDLPYPFRAAEVGAGTGTVAELLARRVGTGGRVLALDTDTRFLEPLASSTIRVRRQDVTSTPLMSGRFDLIHARLLLEHLPARDEVVPSLARALVPGGWLVVEDLDWVSAPVIDPPSVVHQRVTAACRSFMVARGYAPEYGRRLPAALAAAGLRDIGTHAVSTQVGGDAVNGIPQWELLVAQLAPGLLAAGLVTSDDLEEFAALCHDPMTVVFAPLMISCWGRRPHNPTGVQS